MPESQMFEAAENAYPDDTAMRTVFVGGWCQQREGKNCRPPRPRKPKAAWKAGYDAALAAAKKKEDPEAVTALKPSEGTPPPVKPLPEEVAPAPSGPDPKYLRSVARVLHVCMNYRPDVKRAEVTWDPQDPDRLQIDVRFYSQGARLQREAELTEVLDGRTCGEIVAQWIGSGLGPINAHPSSNQTLAEIRRRYEENTPSAMVAMPHGPHPARNPQDRRKQYAGSDVAGPPPAGMKAAPLPAEPKRARKQRRDS